MASLSPRSVPEMPRYWHESRRVVYPRDLMPVSQVLVPLRSLPMPDPIIRKDDDGTLDEVIVKARRAAEQIERNASLIINPKVIIDGECVNPNARLDGEVSDLRSRQ